MVIQGSERRQEPMLHAFKVGIRKFFKICFREGLKNLSTLLKLKWSNYTYGIGFVVEKGKGLLS